MTTSTPTLAEVLTRLIHEERLSYAHIARIGGLSRNTVKQIADGRTTNPNEETLCRISVGLAANPYTGRVHQETMTNALEHLGAAIGGEAVLVEWVRRTLPILVTTLTGEFNRATAWVDLIAQFPDTDPEPVRSFLAPGARDCRQE